MPPSSISVKVHQIPGESLVATAMAAAAAAAAAAAEKTVRTVQYSAQMQLPEGSKSQVTTSKTRTSTGTK